MDIVGQDVEQPLGWPQASAFWQDMWQVPRILWAQWCDVVIDAWMGSLPEPFAWSRPAAPKP